MKKDWILYLVVLLLIYLNSVIYLDHGELHFSSIPGVDFIILLYHALLFLFVNNVLIPKFFYTKKYDLFFLTLLSAIFIWTIIEEGVLEQILAPDSRGMDSFSWRSVYFFIGDIIVPLLAFMTIKFIFDNLERERKMEQIEKDKLGNELKFLKSQIQPHILFNSLNNLYDFTISKSDKAPELVLGLSNVLRYVLYETESEQVTLTKELDFVKDYIALQKMQLEGRGEIHFQVIKSTNIDGLKIAPFLLIPFIENSFKHSLNSKETNIQIKITIEIIDQQLILTSENNFEKIDSSPDELLAKGIGLKNVKKRLELLYPQQHHLEIEEKENWYNIQLKLNLS